MGALDDLIARDEENMRKAAGGDGSMSLDQLLAMDEARNMPSQDPGDGSEETPSFVGYDPASKPAPESPWENLRSIGQALQARDQQLGQGFREWKEQDRRDNGGVSPINRLSEAYVGAALPGAGKGAGLVKNLLVEGGESMGMTALEKLDQYLRDDSGKPVDLSAEARDIGMSGAFGAAGGTAGHYLGKAAGAVKDWAGEAAAKAKNLVTGMGVRDAKATAAMHGVDAIDENYGGLLEKYSPSGLTGKSPKAHHEAVLAEKEAVGGDLRNMAKEINDGLVPDVDGAGSLMPGTPGDLGQARAKLEQELRNEAGGVRGLGADKSQYRGALQDMVDELVGTPGQVRTVPREMHGGEVPGAPAGDESARAALRERQGLGLEPPTDAYWDEVVSETPARPGLKPFESFPDLIGQKSALQEFAHSGPGNSVPESAQKQAAALGGRVLKDEAARIVGQAKPELRDRYTAQNQNFAELATLEEMLRNKAAAEASGGDLGGILGSSAAAGLVGAGTGAVLDDDPIAGAAKGGAGAFLAGFGLQGGAGATRTAIRQAGGGRMTDAGANMLRGLERAAGSVDGTGSNAALASEFAERRSDAEKQSKQPPQQIALGHDVAMQVLKTNPQRLGPFAEMLADAANDPQVWNARVTNLQKQQPMFRKLLRELEDERTKSRPQSGITYSLEGE